MCRGARNCPMNNSNVSHLYVCKFEIVPWIVAEGAIYTSTNLFKHSCTSIHMFWIETRQLHLNTFKLKPDLWMFPLNVTNCWRWCAEKPEIVPWIIDMGEICTYFLLLSLTQSVFTFIVVKKILQMNERNFQKWDKSAHCKIVPWIIEVGEICTYFLLLSLTQSVFSCIVVARIFLFFFR